MTPAEISLLGDVFTRNTLTNGNPPLTLRALVAAIDSVQGPALPIRHMFLIAEGAHFRNAAPPLELNARLAFTWRASTETPVDVLVSTVAAADDPEPGSS